MYIPQTLKTAELSTIKSANAVQMDQISLKEQEKVTWLKSRLKRTEDDPVAEPNIQANLTLKGVQEH